jgi:hypothetical protein
VVAGSTGCNGSASTLTRRKRLSLSTYGKTQEGKGDTTCCQSKHLFLISLSLSLSLSHPPTHSLTLSKFYYTLNPSIFYFICFLRAESKVETVHLPTFTFLLTFTLLARFSAFLTPTLLNSRNFPSFISAVILCSLPPHSCSRSSSSPPPAHSLSLSLSLSLALSLVLLRDDITLFKFRHRCNLQIMPYSRTTCA